MLQPETQFQYLNKISKHSARQPFMIECFATWCGPCRQMVPHLAELHRLYKDKFYIASISDEDEDTVRKMMDEMPDTQQYNLGLDSNKKAEQLKKKYGVNGIPHCFIFDQECKMIWHGHPAESEEHIKQVLKASEGFTGKGRVL